MIKFDGDFSKPVCSECDNDMTVEIIQESGNVYVKLFCPGIIDIEANKGCKNALVEYEAKLSVDDFSEVG